MKKEDLERLLKDNQVLVSTEHKQIGEDFLGFPVFELVYINPPVNYKLIRAFEHVEFAILENLDYEKENS